MGFLHIVWVAIACAALGALTWFFAPKGPSQTLIRSSVAMALTCCYLMWAITYLSQLHPLMIPHRTDLRPDNATIDSLGRS